MFVLDLLVGRLGAGVWGFRASCLWQDEWGQGACNVPRDSNNVL